MFYNNSNENIELGGLEVQEVLDLLKGYVKRNGKIKLIIEIPQTAVITIEALTYLQQQKYKKENTLAVALVISSIAQRIFPKFYHTKVDVGVPTKLALR